MMTISEILIDVDFWFIMAVLFLHARIVWHLATEYTKRKYKIEED